MRDDNGEWVLLGAEKDDPSRIVSPEAAIDYVNKVGFLPLFRGSVPGLSLEEHSTAEDWWTGDERRDPWEWRRVLAASGKVAYGKLFDNKAGFVSLEWLPALVNARRDGYDFDTRVEDGKANSRSRRLMSLFANGGEYLSNEVKTLTGFGKNGEKNFDGTLTELQMQTYLVVRDFRQRRNRLGEPYGWAIAVYTTPESIWGYERVTSAYSEPPELSRQRITEHLRALCPHASEKDIRKLIK